ncbi:uncharacterized protein PF3D7_1120000-like [Impatiens glandulifera]|uniref:uncharacterized protein PF3D7_1120000-like n=1 Tax=Impatiens glandulifera TaxID=253017 RepID=UPI001FB0B092|nr:uncharacterized protein PF3D7_1120000-like [Impatiens glandulifera]
MAEEEPAREVEVAPMAEEETPTEIKEIKEEVATRAIEEEATMAVDEEVCRAEREEAPMEVKEVRMTEREEAEKRFVEKDYNGASSYALRAQILCPSLEGIKEMKTTFDVYVASKTKLKGEIDFYAIFGLKPSAIKARLIKQYKEMYKAFKLLSETWNILSDLSERTEKEKKEKKEEKEEKERWWFLTSLVLPQFLAQWSFNQW